MNVASLALRNILRNRRRSITTIAAMTLGVATVLLFGGFCRYIGYTLETGYVQRGGHIQLQRKDYFLFGSGNPGGYGISGYDAIIRQLQGDPVLQPMLLVATPILNFSGVAGNFASGLSKTVLVTGLNVNGQNALLRWNDYDTFQAGRVSPLTHSREHAAFVGVGVARVLQLCRQLRVADCPEPATPAVKTVQAVPSDIAALSLDESTALESRQGDKQGNRLELLSTSTRGAPNVAALEIVEAAQQGTKELDDVYVAMHLRQAQQLLFGDGTPKVTAVVLQFRHTSDLPAAKARLRTLLTAGALGTGAEPLEIRDFMEIYPFHKQATLMFQTIFGFIAVLIGAIVLFTVSNTMTMAVVERTVEIGTLRALGQRQSGIRRLFLTEGLILGCSAALIGLASSALIATAINHSGWTWLPPGWSRAVPFVVRIWGEAWLAAAAVIGVIVVAAVSAWWPASRAAKLNVVAALRHA